MKENLIIIHGGGPTAVLNCSLYGAVREAQASGLVEHVYGAVGGTGGLLKEKLLDFGSVPEEELERLPTTPATAIGTSRDALEAEDYARMADILAEKHIRYVLMNGGNGTMDACGKLAAVCRDRGISVMGIPEDHGQRHCRHRPLPRLRQRGPLHGGHGAGAGGGRAQPAHPRGGAGGSGPQRGLDHGRRRPGPGAGGRRAPPALPSRAAVS